MKTIFVANENKEIEEAFSISNNEEIIIKKKDKQLTAKQKKLINQKIELKKFCNEQGGFVHMFFVNSKLLFYDLEINRANIARIIYLATYIDYNNRNENLLIRHRKNNVVEAMKRSEIREVLKLSKSSFENFMKEMKENEIIYEANEKFYVNPFFFAKGKEKTKDRSYIRVFIKNTRFLYENCDVRQHKILSYIYQLAPFLNFELNILCKNPYERDFARLKKLSCKEICELLQIRATRKNMYKFRENLKKFYVEIEDRKYYLISYVTTRNEYEIKDYFVINPSVVWAGSNLEENKKILSCLFF